MEGLIGKKGTSGRLTPNEDRFGIWINRGLGLLALILLLPLCGLHREIPLPEVLAVKQNRLLRGTRSLERDVAVADKPRCVLVLRELDKPTE